MAIKPLKTIKFPGLSDTYTVPQVDITPTPSSANAVSSGSVYNALQEKLNVADAVTENFVNSTVNTGLDNVRERTYNLIDCNDASKWKAANNKDVTITIPEADVVRVTSNISQTYAYAIYDIDVTNINTLYTSFTNYSGTGVNRSMIYYYDGNTRTYLGTVSKARASFDVSDYTKVAIVLAASYNTAGTGYIDYSDILVTADESKTEYIPYYIYEPRAEEVLAQIPNLDTTFLQTGSAAESNSVGKFKSSANFSNKNLSNALSNIIPEVVPVLEIGDMTINSSGWTYNDGTDRAKQRVRTAKGYSIPLKKGDKIGLTDYTDAKYYLGWKLSDNTYGSAGWRTSDTIIAYDGDYVILIVNETAVDQTSVDSLGNLLFITKHGGFYNPISVVQRASGSNILKTTTWVDGYITSSGIHAPTDQLEITTDFINIDDATEYRFRLSHARYTDEAENTPWIGIATYDANRTYLRRPTVSTPINVDDDKEYFEYTLIPNSGEKYIRISFRSFGSYSAELVAVNDGVVWYGYDIAEPKDLQNGRYLTMKGVNHRGWGECPENTLIAYKQSAIHGFNYVETDVRYTSDGVPVLLHDASINRTARNADGTTLSSTVNIVDITYAQSQEYDFGIYKGSAFAGTKIPRFEDFILLCKRLALHPYIELKTGMTNAQIINLVGIVRNYGMLDSVTWIAYATGWFNLITTRHARSRIGVLMTSTTQATIDAAKAYRTGKNSVFLDTSAYDASAVALAKANGMPMEAWTLDDDADILALDPYITGVTSNLKIAGAVVYSNLTT